MSTHPPPPAPSAAEAVAGTATKPAKLAPMIAAPAAIQGLRPPRRAGVKSER